MADPALFEFLHTEMVAELWAQDPDPGPGVSAGSWWGGATGCGWKASRGPREARRARQRSGPNTRPAPDRGETSTGFRLCKAGSGRGRPRGLLLKLCETTQGQAPSSKPDTE